MKNTKTTIRELSSRYRDILKKCFYLNAVALGLFAATSASATIQVKDTDGITRTVNTAGEITSFLDAKANTTDVIFSEAAGHYYLQDDTVKQAIDKIDDYIYSVNYEVTATEPDKATYIFTAPNGQTANLTATGITSDSYVGTSVAGSTEGVSAKTGTVVKYDSTLTADSYTYVSYDKTGATSNVSGGTAVSELTDTFTSNKLADYKEITASSAETGAIAISDYKLDAGSTVFTISYDSTTQQYTLLANGTATEDFPGVKSDLVAAYEGDVQALASKQTTLKGYYDDSVANRNKIITAETGVLAQDQATVAQLNTWEGTFTTAGTNYGTDVATYNGQVAEYNQSLSKIVDNKIDTKIASAVAADYERVTTPGSETTTADVVEYVGTNGGKVATIASTAAMIEDVMEDKEEWIGKELGYDTTTTDANTVLAAKGFADQDEDGKVSFVDAVVQNAANIELKLDKSAVATDYAKTTTTTTADVNAYVAANATKLATVKSTADLITDVLEDKEAWIGRELGYDTTTTDANTVLKAKGFADQDGDEKVSFVDAVVQNATAINQEATTRAEQDALLAASIIANDAKVGTTADGTYVTKYTAATATTEATGTVGQNINALDVAISGEVTRATGVEAGLDARLDVLEGTGEGSVSQAIAETAGNLSGVADLAFFKGKTPTATLSAAQDGTAPSVAELMTNLNGNLTSEFARVDRRISKLENKMEKGLAANNALAGLVPLDHAHRTQVSAAMGGYKNNQALAVGAFHYLNDRTLLNAGAAYGGNDSVSYKVGVTFGF